MTRIELVVQKEALQRALDELPYVKCNTCEHWDRVLTVCGKYQAEPPNDVQENGCDEWLWDNIPF